MYLTLMPLKERHHPCCKLRTVIQNFFFQGRISLPTYMRALALWMLQSG